MDIQLTARHLKITQPIRDYVQEKVEKAQKYFDHIVWAQVVLFIEKRAQKAEIVIHAPKQTFRAIATAADLYSAIDLASDKIDGQLKKFKGKLRDRRKLPMAQEGIDAGMPAATAAQITVSKKSVLVLSTDEAAQKIEELGYVFMPYQDRLSGHVRVIYRRGDESYAILQPVKKGGH